MKKSTIIHTTILSGQNINVPAPEAEEALVIQSSPAGNLNFQFDISTASPEREGNDLVLNTEGGSIIIARFFEVGDESLPSLTLEDGTLVDAAAFFEGSGLDLTTAAGEAGNLDSSGTKYNDDAGNILLGVDRLDMLGSEAANAGGTESLSITALAGSDAFLPSDIGGDLGGPGEAILPTIDYDLRAVLYSPSDSSDDSLHLNIRNAFTNPDPSHSGPEVIIGHPEYANEYFTFDPDNPFDAQGNLVLTLSDAGKQQLQSNGGSSIYDYITISINGEEHTIQVVANGNGRFETGFEHPGGVLDENGLAFGEWHQGQDSVKDFNGQIISTSALADELHFTGDITSSKISTNDGNDSFKLTGTLSGSTLDLGEGANQATMASMENSILKSGDGSDLITISEDVSSSEIHLGQSGWENNSGGGHQIGDENTLRVEGVVSDSLITGGRGHNSLGLFGGVKDSTINLEHSNNKIITSWIEGSEVTLLGGDNEISVWGDASGSTFNGSDGGTYSLSASGAMSSSKVNFGDGSDFLSVYSGTENSSLNMGAGDDSVFIFRGIKNSSIDMGAGEDTVNFDFMDGSSINSGQGSLSINASGDISNSSVLSADESFKLSANSMRGSDIEIGDGTADVTISLGISNSSIQTGDGILSVKVGDDFDNSSIKAGDGNLSVIVGSDLLSSSINSESGNDYIEVEGLMKDSSITGGAGEGTINIGEDMMGSSISLGAGKNSVSINGVMLSEPDTKNIISTDSGAIYIGKGMQALGNGQNTINTGVEAENLPGQSFTIKGGSFGMEAAGANASNIIVGGDYLPLSSVLNSGNFTVNVSNAAQSLTVPTDMYGMNALDGGLNSISLGKTNAVITVVNKYGDVVGLHAENGTNLIEGGGNLIVTTETVIGFDVQGLSAQGGMNSIDIAGNVQLKVYDKYETSNRGVSSNEVHGLFSDDGQNIIKAGGEININVNSRNGANVFGVHSANGSSEGFSNELESGGKLIINGSRHDNQHNPNAQTTILKGVSAEGARNSLSAEDSIAIKVENKSANNSETYGVHATASGENHLHGNTSISSITTMNYTPNKIDVRAYGVKADDYGKNIFNGDLNVKSESSGHYFYANAESYGLYAGSHGHNIVHGGLTVLSSSRGIDGTSYGLLAENHGINQVGEMDKLAKGNISINTHGLKTAYNSGKEGYSFGLEARDHGENLFYTTGNVYMLTGDSTLNAGLAYNSIGLHAKDGGLNRIYTAGGSIEFQAWGKHQNIEQVSSTVRADNGINIVESTSGNISMKAVDGNRAHALEAMNNGENHIITQTGKIYLWGKSQSVGSDYDAVVYAENGGVNYIGNVHHDADGKPIDQHLSTAKGITVTVEDGYTGVSSLRYSLEAKDGGTNVIRTNAGNDTIRLIGNVQALGSGKNIIDAGDGDNTIEIFGFVRGTEISTGSGNDKITIDGNLYNVNIDAGTGHDIIKGLIFYNNDINNPHYILAEYGEINIQKMHSEFEGNTGLEANGDIYSTIETIGADVNITADKGQDYSTMRAYSATSGPNNEYSVDAHNLIKTDSGNISLNLTNTQLANSMEAIGRSSNIIETNSGDINISALADEGGNLNSAATGMFASNGAKNIIRAIDHENNHNNISITIIAKGNMLSQALKAENYGENHIITGQGDDTITLTGDLYAASGGVNRIETHGGDDRIQIDGSVRAGQNSVNEILTGAGNDTLIINGGPFAGLIGYANKSKNIIDTGSGDDIVTINGGIFGLSSSEQIVRLGDGQDMITINGDIELQGDGTFALDAGDGDDIIIFNGKVIGSGTLTVDGGTGYDQLVLQASDLNEFIERYGAWLKQPGLIENIDAIKFEGLSEADRAELQSGGFLDNLGGISIYTDDGILTDLTDLESFSALAGVNYSGEFSEDITGLTGMIFKDGDDRLVFNSKLSDSVLSMGEGDDLILVNSNIESVQLNMGEGNDSLYISHAALDSQISLGSGDDHLYINSDFFNPNFFDPAGSSFDGGEGNDTLHLQLSGELKLSEIADLFKGFETIDLSGGGDSILDIDSLIGESEKPLMIKGDEGQDKVTLSDGDWSYKETQVHGDVSYGVYSHAEDDAALILIQLGLMN